MTAPSFGIMTAPMQVDHHEVAVAANIEHGPGSVPLSAVSAALR